MSTAEKWLTDTGIACSYDEDIIEYGDAVIVLLAVKPYIEQSSGALLFWDIRVGDPDEPDDYYYEPVFFHAYNWEALEEKLEEFLQGRLPIAVEGAILDCWFCKSGILAGETMGVATMGEIIRSHRNPDLKVYGNHFENLDRRPRYLCISCLHDLNAEVLELWPEGVCHDEECEEGTIARCWRSGCPGNCPKKIVPSDEDEEEDTDEE